MTCDPDSEEVVVGVGVGEDVIDTTLGKAMTPPRCTQSGFRVAKTKNTATDTVTAWEKTSQVLRMETGGTSAPRRREGESAKGENGYPTVQRYPLPNYRRSTRAARALATMRDEQFLRPIARVDAW